MFATVPSSDDRRSGGRLAVERRAVLRTQDAAHEIELLDLTSGGCRFRCQASLALYERVSIGIAGVGHSAAQLVWQADTIYGCAFERPLPDHAVTAAAPDNVARILTATQVWQVEYEGDIAEEEKLPVRVRVAVIAGTTVVLWAAIIAGLRVLFAHLG
jgi:PilZ domain